MTEPKVPALGPTIAAIVFNVAPIVGVLFWGWSAFALIFLYWLENIAIGVRTVLSMLANAAIAREVNFKGALFFSAFFTIHYGIFCYGHGAFVVTLFGADRGASMFDVVGAGRALFAEQPGLVYGLASIILWQVVQFAAFLARGDAAKTTPMDLMGAPYPRIIVLHLAIILGGFILLGANEPVAGLVILALVKMAFDVAEVGGAGLNLFRPRSASGPPGSFGG